VAFRWTAGDASGVYERAWIILPDVVAAAQAVSGAFLVLLSSRVHLPVSACSRANAGRPWTVISAPDWGRLWSGAS
jgi:hypothetical protein